MQDVSLETWYDNYLSAFNSQDIGALQRYLHIEIVFDWDGAMDDLVGRDAFFDFYRVAWRHLRENVSAQVLEADEKHIRALVQNTLEVIEDWPDSPLRPYVKGEIIQLAGEMTYTLDQRKITRIR
ncbi:hypothetical protein [Arthrobacter sp. efr-133-TYG-120]|jgi:hypothetical protein|uniref:hypothetical protein n=1 Tax=Arthrobacter sp. efr-133-TYG-120 TaxID=3040280 RepID=UPI00254A7BAB|nr:hypothetical protein [Arthrobacter sp. efr-133-TYG-120]